MDVLRDNIHGLKKVSLILGFFDGIHAGHAEVIKSGVEYARIYGTKSVLLTFSKSPSEHFGQKFEYIYSRKISYDLISEWGVDYIIEKDFSDIANISAEKYLETLIRDFQPISISTGFNHTFGLNKSGSPAFLEEKSSEYGYKYFCVQPCEIDGFTVSSTLIKKFLKQGEIGRANTFLTKPFRIESKVIEGEKVGRKLGFPTANMKYPETIVKLPYGVYASKYKGMPAVLNWGVKPSVGKFKEGLELHIPNFNENLYNKVLEFEILKKIRDEKKFATIKELKEQITEDVKECLKL